MVGGGSVGSGAVRTTGTLIGGGSIADMFRLAWFSARPVVACLTVASCGVARTNPADAKSKPGETYRVWIAPNGKEFKTVNGAVSELSKARPGLEMRLYFYCPSSVPVSVDSSSCCGAH